MTTILCFGDSNTWGFNPADGSRFPPEVRWPGVMKRHLPPAWQVIEEALCGRTALLDDPFEAGRNGLPYLVPCLASHAPVDLVVLMLGTNDVKSFFPYDAAGVAAGVTRLAETVLRSQSGPGGAAPKVLIVAPAPVTVPRPLTEVWGFDARAVERSRRLAPYYRAAAEKLGVGFLDAGPLATVSPIDGVHLDEAALALLGATVARQVELLLR
jgi:lysophospholipase L1-like esterase